MINLLWFGFAIFLTYILVKIYEGKRTIVGTVKNGTIVQTNKDITRTEKKHW